MMNENISSIQRLKLNQPQRISGTKALPQQLT